MRSTIIRWCAVCPDIARRDQAPQLLSRTISQDGDTYSRQSASGDFDAFGHPLRIVRSNSFGYSATDTYTYQNDATNWVLGLTLTHAINGVTEDKNVYTSLDQVQEWDHFGLLQFTYGYDAAGLLRTRTDGLTHTTKFDSYAFGTAQLVTFADATTAGKVVAADGTITSSTDERGFTTHYAYDGIQRLKTVTYPSPDTVAWAPVNISWQAVTASPFGAAAMLQKIDDGHLVHSVYYDPLLRPIFEQESDSVSGVARYRRRSFDSASRLVFQSYPDSAVSTVNGVATSYDALGRPVRHSDAVGLLTSIAYSSGDKRTVTDGNGHSLAYSAQTFDRPGGDDLTLIAAPETQTTQITRDVFGHVQSVKQSGTYSGSAISATRTYVYDSNLRLCKSVDPESGETALVYDAANNLVWKAVGQTNSPTTCSTQSSTLNGTSYTYDPRNHLLSVLVSGGGPNNITYSYYPDGRKKSVATLASTWNYSYDGRGLLEQQSLVGLGKTFAITDQFDPQGNRTQRTYPSSRVVALSPDAWGEPTQLGTFATGVQYYPSGSVAGFSYGNGVAYAQTLDTRLRPHSVHISGTLAGDMMDMTYGYDAVGNIQTITDNGARGDSRTMTYDGLNRISTANSPLGNATFAYDPLNNLRQQQSSTGLNVTAVYNAVNNRVDGITGTYNRTFTRSPAGDIINDGANQYGFDFLHRMLSVSGGASAAYFYDGNYRRYSTSDATGLTFTVYDDDGLLVAGFNSSSGVSTDYLSLDGQSVAEIPSVGTTTYLHADPLGSPGAATDATGKWLWYEHYLPYGSKVNGVSEKIGFAGHIQDSSTGLVAMQSRYYSPLTGQFLSIDTASVDAGSPFSFNRYAYANNNPQRFKDPDGKSPIDIVFLAVDLVELGSAISSGSGIGAAAIGVGLDLVGVASPIPGTGEALKAVRTGVEVAEHAAEVAKVASEAEHAAVTTERTAAGYANNTGAKITEGGKFTAAQKADFKAQNAAKNGGTLRSDQSGIELVPAKKSERGVTPPSNEVAIDHYDPRNPESGPRGSNDGSNARVVSRAENGEKSNKIPKEKGESGSP